MCNKIRLCVLVFLLSFLFLRCGADELYDRLIALEGVASVEEIDKGFFDKRYVVMFEQPLDHSSPGKGRFEQRFVISHAGFDRPSLLITDGYDAARAYGTSRGEISYHLNTNQIFVEHRYFGESQPSPRDWAYLTGENAAGDLHNIRQALSGIYPGKWIASGVSKGGQNALIYRMFFPDDVDVTVAYVAPVCFAVEDGRHKKFLEEVGSAEERGAVLDFQKELLRRKGHLMPLLTEYCTTRKYEYRLPLEEIYEYCVLEYSFAFWQRGMAASLIPPSDSPHEDIFYHFVSVVPPNYFSIGSEPPLFVQSVRELGYYGYDTAPLQELLTIESAKDYIYRILLPDDARRIKFSGNLSARITEFYRANDPRLICVYGELDPWSAAALDPSLFEGKTNMKFYVEPRGNHKTGIGRLPEEMKNEAWNTLERWMQQ